MRPQLSFRKLTDAGAQQLLFVSEPHVHVTRDCTMGCRGGGQIGACAMIATMRVARLSLFAALLVLIAPSVALADATVFLGVTTTPEGRPAKGFAIGAGLLIVGFEFEYAHSGEDAAAPSLWTGTGNVLLQTPVPVGGFQLYLTTGGGVYRERLGSRQETSFGVNSGGGAKVSLIGPIRVRLDYRVFKLQGDPIHSVVHRVYAGLNLGF